MFFSGGEVEKGAEGQTGDGQVLAGHDRGDRSEEQGGAGQRDGGVLHLLPEGRSKTGPVLPPGGGNCEMSCTKNINAEMVYVCI